MESGLLTVALGLLTVTSYLADPKQTDSTPFHTSINQHVHPFGAAVSEDFLKSGEACYGDVLYVEGYGLRVVNDVMNARHKRRVDLFVDTKQEEAFIGVQHANVWVIRSPVRACTREGAMKMAMVNSKRIRKGMAAFKKQNGREPNYEEFRNILRGDLRPRASNPGPGQETSSRSSARRRSH